MKTTVKTASARFEVKPSLVGGCIEINVYMQDGRGITGNVLTADQAGALIFGMEQALETHEVAAQRMAA